MPSYHLRSHLHLSWYVEMQDGLERVLRLRTENMFTGERSIVKPFTSEMAVLLESPKRLNYVYEPCASASSMQSSTWDSNCRRSRNLARVSKLLTTDEVAEIIRLSPETLAQWRWLRKEIPFIRLGPKCVRYRQCDVDAWIEKRLVPVSCRAASSTR